MSDIAVLERGGAGYPPQLETIADPPDRLWVRGSLPRLQGVAIVGSRKATSYGRGLARSMGAAVAGAGWAVVSGLARGVDGAAHRGCLDAGGAGIAVLGCGVDVWYPPEHRTLGESLAAAGGAVVSEFPPGTRPEPWRFPVRNRLISGLAGAVVVCEAAEAGGALITARLAAEQGREVLAVPGDVSRPTSMGANLLIRDGAIPVMGPDDLLEELSLLLGPPPRGPTSSRQAVVLGVAVPPEGAPLDLVVEANGGDAAGVLAELGRLEAAGRVVMEDGVVLIRR